MLVKINEISNNFEIIEIKQYLPFGIKHSIIKNILESSIVEENGIKRIDYSILEMVKQYSIVNNYSNIDLLEGEVTDSFDQLKELGIMQFVLTSIPSDELDFFDKVIAQEINQIQHLDNSIEAIIANGINQLISKIPDEKSMNKLLKDLPKQINKISPESLKYLTQAMSWDKGVVDNA